MWRNQPDHWTSLSLNENDSQSGSSAQNEDKTEELILTDFTKTLLRQTGSETKKTAAEPSLTDLIHLQSLAHL